MVYHSQLGVHAAQFLLVVISLIAQWKLDRQSFLSRRKQLSRGISDKRIINKHAWKPALMPIITVMGMNIAMMLAGAILTETTFEWKGLGYQLSQLIKARDFNAVQGIVILIAIIVSVTNFIVDILAAAIDPRVRQSGEDV